MKAHLIKAACEVITDQKMLVNVISRRVRQLAFGHRPLVACPPGMGLADVALTEVIEGKLTYESTLGAKETDAVKTVVPFPAKKATQKKAA
ncbi:MAG TPA: DNA-directed RNA polymerase subunit omega [Chthoniobacterales bacterium]|jgi:DNA-directed RNA polymerase subunit omega|nr:DNA-directed RNA polymerase subunit omega [Chthoniobacterales bacterium]